MGGNHGPGLELNVVMIARKKGDQDVVHAMLFHGKPSLNASAKLIKRAMNNALLFHFFLFLHVFHLIFLL